MKTTYIFVVLFAFSCIACTPDPLPPADYVMDLAYPAEGAVYNAQDTVKILAELSVNNGELHGYELYVYDTVSLAVLLNSAKHLHENEVIIDTFFVNRVTSLTTAKLELRMYSSHGEEPRLLTRNLTLKP